MIIMKWKNKKKKIQYIEEMSKWDNQLIQQKFSVLLKLSKDKNPEVREMLAENLVLFECEEAEEILYNMLSDKNRMVRPRGVRFDLCWTEPESNRESCHYDEWTMVSDSYVCRNDAV